MSGGWAWTWGWNEIHQIIPPGRARFADDRTSPYDSLPPDQDNLVVKALLRLREIAGIDRGADVWLTKRIPAAAGLGGASSDAAAALVGANILWEINLPPPELESLAGSLGSDLPFFVRGQAIGIGRGRGE